MPNPFAADDGPQPPKTLTAPLEILANLRPLQMNHIPLVIRFHDRGSRYQSYLVEVDRDSGYLALDEIMPSDGERYMRSGEPFDIEGFYEGARMAWTNREPAEQGELDEMPCHWVLIPTELSYHQRRNAYRASLLGQKVSARLEDASQHIALDGNLLDISATGCKLQIPGQWHERLKAGALYERLVARLPFGTIETAVELRHAKYDEQYDNTRCGLRFHRISGVQQRQLERYVNQLQRESRRNLEGRFA
ncbi:flagellar brake protein [Stutzerimonas tarimensis]|uniref:Flagellar brake protein n=1 Tax=Stutzerimonas tarimensis TaxID=1507735 RepID=A0ABV7T7W8_9GAMM